MKTRYQEIKSTQVPVAEMDNGVRIKVICGEIDGIKGPVEDIVTDPEYLDILIPPETAYLHPTKAGHTVFAYVLEGEGTFGRDQDSIEVKSTEDVAVSGTMAVGHENLVVFGNGDEILATSGSKAWRFLLISGKPINEPIAWRGPIVMNTQEELDIAFKEYMDGTFIKSDSSD